MASFLFRKKNYLSTLWLLLSFILIKYNFCYSKINLDNIDWFIDNFKLNIKQSEEQPTYLLQSKQALHYTKQKYLSLEEPHIIIQPNNSKQDIWHITAKYGYVDYSNIKQHKVDNIILRNNIHITNDKDIILSTNELMIYPENKLLYTKQKIKLQQKHNVITGIGGEYQLHKKTFRIFNNVYSIFTKLQNVLKNNSDNEQPLKIKAKSLYYDKINNMAYYNNDVQAYYDNKILNAEKIEIFNINQKSLPITVIATGHPVTLWEYNDKEHKRNLLAKAENMRYSQKDNLLILQKKAQLIKNGNKISTEKIIYNIKNDSFNSVSNTSNHRTHIIINNKVIKHHELQP